MADQFLKFEADVAMEGCIALCDELVGMVRDELTDADGKVPTDNVILASLNDVQYRTAFLKRLRRSQPSLFVEAPYNRFATEADKMTQRFIEATKAQSDRMSARQVERLYMEGALGKTRRETARNRRYNKGVGS